MTDTRENWTSRSGFIIAAVGSAVGLGNIWRFPYVAYENGGGAFLIPYLLALITAGLPLLFLDYAVGHRSTSSPPKAYRALFKGGETLGGGRFVSVSSLVCTMQVYLHGLVAMFTSLLVKCGEVIRKVSSLIPICRPQKQPALIYSL